MSDLFLHEHFIDRDSQRLCEIVWNGTTELMPDRSFDGRKQMGTYALEGETRPRYIRQDAPAHRGPQPEQVQ